MNKIEVKVLNPSAIYDAKNMMALGAKLTQHGHEIKNINDVIELYNKIPSDKLIENLSELPHPTLQKFTKINVVISGASRRFLAQITRHQNEVKFMSASLQYSDYSSEADFVIPYSIIDTPQEKEFLQSCKASMEEYQKIVDSSLGNDAAGYVAPQALRNILLISATPYQWKHMIHQRTCRRNTDETRYVMLLIWEQLYNFCPEIFSINTTGPFCQQDKCLEGKMSCGRYIDKSFTPKNILDEDFEKIRRVDNEN